MPVDHNSICNIGIIIRFFYKGNKLIYRSVNWEMDTDNDSDSINSYRDLRAVGSPTRAYSILSESAISTELSSRAVWVKMGLLYMKITSRGTSSGNTLTLAIAEKA